MTQLKNHINRFITRNGGSVRKAASVLDVSHPYLYRLSTGERDDPSDEVLAKLGLRRIVTYVPITKENRRAAK